MAQRTKKRIQETFLAMLEQESLDKITVKDLVDRVRYEPQYVLLLLSGFVRPFGGTAPGGGGKDYRGPPRLRPLQEGFLDAIAFVLEHRRAAYHVFNSNARAYVTRYFLRLGDFILTDVVRELSAGLPVSLEDRRILVDFYKHALVGVVSDWLEQGMKEDLSAVIRRIGVLLEGNIRRALENSIANG